jgi:hypothetical protein
LWNLDLSFTKPRPVTRRRRKTAVKLIAKLIAAEGGDGEHSAVEMTNNMH